MSGITDFAGFTKGVLGKETLPSDSTLNNMKKTEVIELLHLAQRNYDALLWAYGNAVKFNEKQIKETAIDSAQKWISVEDKMPEEHDSIFARFYGTKKWRTGMYRTVSNDVIACLKGKNGHRMVKVLSTQDGDWNVNSIYQAEVTHWMPLPGAVEEDE